jgi:phage FluMu gp28-like protein
MIEIPFVGKTLDQMASLLLNEFRSRNVALYPDQLLIRDLGRLSIIEKSYGYKLESTRDADGHADRGTALTLAILAAKSAPIVDTSPIIWDLEAIRELSSGRRTFRTY